MADKTASSSGSPWDEPLDIPENDTTKPQVVGDLDFSAEKKPDTTDSVSSLKVPDDIEEKVGAKEPAANFSVPKATPVENSSIPAPVKTQVQVERPEISSSNSPAPIKPAENGVSELTKPIPVAPPPVTEELPKPAKIKSPYEFDDLPAPASPPPAEASVANLDIKPVSMPANDLSAPKPVEAKPLNQNEEVNIPVTNLEAKAMPTPPPAKPAQGFDDSHLFAQAQPKFDQQPAPFANNAKPAPSVAPEVKGNSKLKKIIFSLIAGVLILVAAGITVTEMGIASFGFENIYSITGIETLWGGLPKDAEKAFAISALKMSNESSFSVEGKGTFTITRGVKSDIIGPIVALSNASTAVAADQSAAPGQKAVLTADTLVQNSNSPVVTVEELSATINMGFSKDVSGAKINLKNKKSVSSYIDLVYGGNKLYFKTSDNIVYNAANAGSWMTIDNSKVSGLSPVNNKLLGSDLANSGFSMTGERVGNEVVNGVRCYHYKGTVQIGDALKAFGLTTTSAQSVNVEFWSGTKDHLIHQIKLTIIPAVESAVTRISLDLLISGYGDAISGYTIPSNSKTYSGNSDSTVATRDQTRKADLKTISDALASYFKTKNAYPIAKNSEKISATSGTLYSALVPTYTKSLPVDPMSGTYYYGYKSDGKTYELSAVLESSDDKDGTIIGSKNIYFIKK